MRTAILLGLAIVALTNIESSLSAGDWPQFRGPHGAGISDDSQVPTTWSDSENLAWKLELPGAGASSPIVLGDRVFVTAFSGFGEGEKPQRHLLCVNLNDGEVVWSKSRDAVQPEDSYRGFITQHGYASSTPVTDGERLYVFFGKTGVLAFDLDGNQIWQTSVGTESGRMRWGSAASPVLYKDLLIVNASDESQSLRALNKRTGSEVWKAQAAGLNGCWSTPTLLDLEDGRQELAVSVPFEMWGFNPDNGKLAWYAETDLDTAVCPTMVSDGGVLYAVGGRQGGCVAIRAGGKDDVTKSHVVWSGRSTSYVPSPVLQDGRLYCVSDRGIAFCVDAASGKEIGRKRLPGGSGGGGGFGGGQFYASVVWIDGKLYAVSRTGGTQVLEASPEFPQLAHNQFASDESDFNASPAVSQGKLLLRSNRFLYCVAE